MEIVSINLLIPGAAALGRFLQCAPQKPCSFPHEIKFFRSGIAVKLILSGIPGTEETKAYPPA